MTDAATIVQDERFQAISSILVHNTATALNHAAKKLVMNNLHPHKDPEIAARGFARNMAELTEAQADADHAIVIANGVRFDLSEKLAAMLTLYQVSVWKQVTAGAPDFFSEV